MLLASRHLCIISDCVAHQMDYQDWPREMQRSELLLVCEYVLTVRRDTQTLADSESIHVNANTVSGMFS
jgi:hypothetical protein